MTAQENPKAKPASAQAFRAKVPATKHSKTHPAAHPEAQPATNVKAAAVAKAGIPSAKAVVGKVDAALARVAPQDEPAHAKVAGAKEAVADVPAPPDSAKVDAAVIAKAAVAVTAHAYTPAEGNSSNALSSARKHQESLW